MSVQTKPDRVTVRMYNVGFGDAFLLLFPGPERPFRVLIDCGTHSASPRPRPISEVVEQIVTDVTDEDGQARIDVVVGTHRHQDHVEGFRQAAWGDVEVKEVWMPWTEDPNDPEARMIREKQSSSARQLCLALERLDADPDYLALAANSLTNEKAMRTLHAGFKGSPRHRFLPLKEGGSAIETDALGQVRVNVLGPSRDPEVIRDMDPPAGESYLRLLGVNEEASSARSPFPASWQLSVEEVDDNPGLKAAIALDKRDRDRLARQAAVDAFALAVALEKAVNGTSLVLMFELGDAHLLCPGDAQWGTWHHILSDTALRALVERTTFLKVGHHGSHNGTPKEFVETLQERRKAEGRVQSSGR